MGDVQRQIAIFLAGKTVDDLGRFLNGEPLRIFFTVAATIVSNILSPAPVTAFAKSDCSACLGKPCAISDCFLDGSKDFPFPGFGYFSRPNISEVFF